jgi:hypothetical protein
MLADNIFFSIAMDAAAPGRAQSKNAFGFFSRLIPSEFDAPRRINYILITAFLPCRAAKNLMVFLDFMVLMILRPS